jgi:hypothetical protein
MTPEETRHLLGGYASGTLSDSEKKLLFEAALEDQVLFDAMADEQALKDLLDDPESRGYLQAVLDEPGSRTRTRPDVSLFAVRSTAAPQAPPAPAPASGGSTKRREFQTPVRPLSQRPAMWWGLLAAAGLAGVSVVEIHRMDRDRTTTEVALSKPAFDSRSEASKTSGAEKVPQSKAGKSTPAPLPAPAATPARRADGPVVDKLKEAEQPKPADQKKPAIERDKEVQLAQNAKDGRAAEPVQTAESRAAVPEPQSEPPAPAKQQQQNAVSQDQTQVSQQQGAQVPTAREQYFSSEQSPGGGQGSAPVAKSASAQEQNKRKASPAPAGALASSRAGAGVAGGHANGSGSAPAQSKPAFAMRVRLLRKNAAGDFASAPPDTKFRVGEELVVLIEKNSGGFAVIHRANESAPVPMTVQTSEVARSAPLTVTGSMELIVSLSPTPISTRPGLPQSPVTQQTESVDGMIYAAEPAAGSPQSLVVRIPIRLGP